MSLLTVSDLSLKIGAHPILNRVSFSVDKGEIVAVTGESGSGKSMTALAVMQLLPSGAVAQGRITLNERDVLSESERALCAMRGNEVGMIFQEPMTALNPVMTIGDQVAETILVHGAASRAEAEARAAEMLARVGLDPERIPPGRYPHELSGGQRQRVVIAMAIALRPALLIADEPTTALDVTTQAQILDLLRGLVDEFGMGLLIITHDLAVVADLADRIVVMRHGDVVEQGGTAQLFKEMRHPYTRALFEASGHQVTLPPEPETRTPLLEVKGAVRDYPLPRKGLFGPRRHARAVNNVSFTLHEGERIGLVGESGCGKSTLTRALLGLEPLQEGTITLGGAPVGPEMPSAQRARIQVVFQDPYGAFNPRHTVARIVTEPYHLLSDAPVGNARTHAVAEALEAVGLKASDAEKYIHEFSGGQRQRVAIARALIIRPDLIVFDEAVSALDVSVRAQILDLIADLAHETGLSYLFISHDLSVVRSVCDRVLVMQHGEVVEDGPAEDVFLRPTHPYTQKLIAAAPVLPEIGKDSP